jgi:hypothetical protein
MTLKIWRKSTNNALRTIFMMLLQSHQYLERLNLNLKRVKVSLWDTRQKLNISHPDAVEQKNLPIQFYNHGKDKTTIIRYTKCT